VLQRVSSTEIGLLSESSSEVTEESKVGALAATNEATLRSLQPRPLHHLGVQRSELVSLDSDAEESTECR